MFYCKGDSTLEQVSIFGAIQNTTEHNPSSLLCMTSKAGPFGLKTFPMVPSNLNCSVILCLSKG